MASTTPPASRPWRSHRLTRPNCLFTAWSLRVLHKLAYPLVNITTNVEIPVFHSGEHARLVYAGRNALLHDLADAPVLSVNQVPEVHRVGRIESRFLDLVRLEEEE